MDYKNELQSDDDFDSSNGFSDHATNNIGYNSNAQIRLSDTNGLSKAELRKTNKPIMEKRRRARINHCLNELKTLILEAMKKDPARHTKLEKADILEMTVKHLQSVQRQQLNMALQTDPGVIHKFKSGFEECAEEVTRYINQLDGVDATVRQGLINHLHKCANNIDQIGSMTNFNSGYNLANSIATATITAPTSAIFPPLAAHDLNNYNGVPTASIQMGGVQLIPSRLPSGELALIVPNGNRNLHNTSPFAVWPPQSLVPVQPHVVTAAAAAATVNHATVTQQSYTDFTTNVQQNMSAFTKPLNLQQQSTPSQPQPQSQFLQQRQEHKKSSTQIITPKPKIFHHVQTNNSFAQNSTTTTTSPPLSPISTLSSHGDESSSALMHTSSEYGTSRSATPPQDISLVDKQHFSEVFATPPSSADTSLLSSNSSGHLQQQQVTSTSERDQQQQQQQNNNRRKRSFNNSTDSTDSYDDEPSAKKFAMRNDINTEDEANCWRPW